MGNLEKKVKICGITNYEDAYYAQKYGADAIGFVFYEKSPRNIDIEMTKEIISKLPPFITKVGLFVNVTAKEVDEICEYTKIDIAQIHFEPSKSFFEELKTKHIKVIRAKSKDDILKYRDEYIIVDAFVEEYGGMGKRVNLEWFEGVDKSKIILAGGLNIENIDEVKNLGFHGFDVSSSVEVYKGKKDLEKVKTFIEKIKL
jgi:phosphoribosylanthranilate isomerase